MSRTWIQDPLAIFAHEAKRGLVVEKQKITSILEEQLSHQRYIYPKKAYQTINIPKKIDFIPTIPNKNNFKINVIKTELPGIVTIKEIITINQKRFVTENWKKIPQKKANEETRLKNSERKNSPPLLLQNTSKILNTNEHLFLPENFQQISVNFNIIFHVLIHCKEKVRQK